MNDDPTPSFAARQPPNTDEVVGHDEQSGSSDNTRNATSHGDNEPGPSRAAEVASEVSHSRLSRRLRRQQRRKHKEGLAKKLEFLKHLHRSLDTLVFAYLCTLYYMECSIFFLLVRLFPHYALISPKAVTLILPTNRPYVFAILIPNVFCMICHALLSLPQAGEATRGYLHGGAIIDFVGQRPPTSKKALLYFDVMILVLQCLTLAVHLDKERIRRALVPSLRALTDRAAVARVGESNAGTEEQTAEIEDVAQDHDAEERGVLRDEQQQALPDDDDDVNETQPLTGGDGRGRPDDRIGMGHSQLRGNTELVDVLQSGNGMLGTFHVIHTLRTAGDDTAGPVASLREYAAAVTGAMAADRRARLATLAVQ